MRFLMLQLGDRSADGRPAGSSRSFEPADKAISEYEDDLRTAGVVLASERLDAAATATSVRFAHGDEPIILAGPSGQTGLVLRGFRIVELRSWADAVAWARRCPIDQSLAEGERAEIEIHEIDERSTW